MVPEPVLKPAPLDKPLGVAKGKPSRLVIGKVNESVSLTLGDGSELVEVGIRVGGHEGVSWW